MLVIRLISWRVGQSWDGWRNSWLKQTNHWASLITCPTLKKVGCMIWCEARSLLNVLLSGFEELVVAIALPCFIALPNYHIQL